MSIELPSVLMENGLITITLATGFVASTVKFEGVVDQTLGGDVVGLEILDLRGNLDVGRVPTTPSSDLPRCSYDEEIDALYVRLVGDDAPIQTKVSGAALVDQAGQLLSLTIRVPPSRL